MKAILLPAAFVAPNKAKAHVLGLCEECDTPHWEEAQACRLLTAEDHAEPEIRRALAVARGNLNRSRRSRAAEQAAALGHLAVPAAQGLDRPTISGLRRRLMADENTTDHKPLVLLLLAEALLINGDHLQYRPGHSDVTIAASASKRFAETVREVLRDQKRPKINRRLLAQAIREEAVTAGFVAQVRGSLRLPLRDPVEPEVLGMVSVQTKALAAQMAALRVELGVRVTKLLLRLNSWTERNDLTGA